MHRVAAFFVLAVPFCAPAGAADTFYTTTDNDNPLSPYFLARIDIASESLEIVGEIGVYTPDCLVYSWDGSLYGVDALADRLLRIDPLTGVGSPIGSTGVFSSWQGAPDLAEDDSGQMWMLAPNGTLYRVNRETGAATPECDVSVGAAGLTYRYGVLLTSPDFDEPPPGCGLGSVALGSAWLTTDSNGLVFGMYYPSPTAPATTIVRVDPDTGEHEYVAFIWGHDLRGIARAPAGGTATRIPALDWRGAVVMVIATALGGIATLRSGSPRP